MPLTDVEARSFTEQIDALLTFFCTFSVNDREAEELTTRFTFGPNGDPTLLHNLLANAILASSASVADRKLPSPSLFRAANAGNSHSTNGHFGSRGFCKADLMALMAAVSRFAVDVGAFTPPPPPEGKLKRNNCDDVCCRIDVVGFVEENDVQGSSSTAWRRRSNERGSVDIIGKDIIVGSCCCIVMEWRIELIFINPSTSNLRKIMSHVEYLRRN